MDYYELGKKGTYENIIKHYGPCSDNFRNTLKGLNDRNDTDLLIRLYNKLTFSFCEICVVGIRPLVNYVLNNNVNVDINLGLWGACEGGHRDIVDLLIKKGGNNWNNGMLNACRGGHMDLVDMMIKKGANDWNNGMWNACYSGYIDIVKYMVEKGANDWNSGLQNAIYNGHLVIVKYMVEKGANNWNSGLQNAIYNGHLDIIKYMVEKGADNFNFSLDIACKYRHWAIVEYLLSIGATGVISKSHIDYYKYLASKLNKPRSQVCHGLYEVLSNLIALYT